jgi:hypothetical protein
VLQAVSGGQASTGALSGSTEEEQFHGDGKPATAPGRPTGKRAPRVTGVA